MADALSALGDDAAIVQMSPCFGGVVRTWLADGESRLWHVADGEWLLAQQCWGLMQRTQTAPGRFREFGILSASARTLLVEPGPRAPDDDEGVRMEPRALALEPVDAAGDVPAGAFKELLDRVVAHSVTSREIVTVETGGWSAPAEPYCSAGIVIRGADELSVVETAPEPTGSKIWGLHMVPGRPVQSLTAPATYEALSIVPALMLEAIATWDVSPWDLTVTFAKQ